MMRGKRHWSLAVRRPDGGIFIKTEELNPLALRYPVLKWPVLRGVIALWESMSLGIKALSISANISVEEEDFTISRKEMALSFGLGILLAVGLFVVLPLYATKQVEGWFPNSALFILAEGILRIIILILYIVVVSRISQLRRLFEYHGAEHKTIHAFEHGLELDADSVGSFSPLHPRCGTSFLLVVMVLAIIVFSFVGIPGLFWLVLSRLIGIPLIIGLSYEVIKYAGKHTDSRFMRAVMYPGLLLQRLTTREPDTGQIEVAIAALKGVTDHEPVELDHSGAADLEVMA
ncbi:MAG: DUF1385 domain-containing protein [Gaiellales bacterium]|nr:MAG: DUF1385 domain-containing protein [Gaiellales bacterium]